MKKITKFICTITSNNSADREYEVTTTSAMACAREFGRCEASETVTVSRKSGRILSRVLWTPEDGGHYYRVVI